MNEDLTPFLSSTKSSKNIFQFCAPLLSKPSAHVGEIQFVVSCLHIMVQLKQTSNELQTLDYDNIPL
jgi:hypothetical protein